MDKINVSVKYHVVEEPFCPLCGEQAVFEFVTLGPGSFKLRYRYRADPDGQWETRTVAVEADGEINWCALEFFPKETEA